MAEVKAITIPELLSLMRKMEIGGVIGVSEDMTDRGEAVSWWGIVRISLGMVDDDAPTWIIQYYGGCGTPAIVSDWNDGQDVEEDLKEALKWFDLLQEDGTILIDKTDLKGAAA